MTLALPSLRPILGALLLLLAALLAVAGFREEPRFGWYLIGAMVTGTWLGWALRQLWLYPRRLARAEARWAEGAPASEVAELLSSTPLATGELGYRLHLLRGLAHAALGYRDRAWLDALNGQLARLPWWKRLLLSRAFQAVPELPSARRLVWGERLIRLAPHLGRLRHLQGILLLRAAEPEAMVRAWRHFEAALPLSWDDPLLLEDLMLAGLQHGREELAEQAMAVLTARHGDPRIPWDRGAAGMRLLRQGRPVEALALVQGLPPAQRHHPLPWLTESIARRQLGDREGAWRVIEAAIDHLPDEFRLWMERHQVALERQQEGEAPHSLERALGTLPESPQTEPLRQEWHLRRAEFAFWWEDRPALARAFLEAVPPDRQGDHHPPLRLQIQVAEGDYEAAYAEVVRRLKDLPQDVDLLLLQADCLAGMEAWEALLPYLEGLGEACRERSAFWHLRGLARAHLGDPLPARMDLERAARMDPGDPRCLLDAGHACAELADWDRAEEHWRQALHLDPRDEEALLHLAEARRALEDLEGARRYLRECLLHHPDSLEAQSRLAELEAN
jgi:tetratricopeptide (TPR) repeat protein